MKTTIDQLEQELRQPIIELHKIRDAFLFALKFAETNAARDPQYRDTYLLHYLSHDFMQSVCAIPVLAIEGILSASKRETRFILEAAIKLCCIQQNDYTLPIAKRMQNFQELLSTSSITMGKNVPLKMLSEEKRGEFNSEVGRTYGEVCNFVHLTPHQMNERIRLTDAGRISGKESAEDIVELCKLTERVFALALVYIFHAAPSFVTGDFFVEGNGSSVSWHFSASKWMAEIDAHFDYKHERQASLSEIARLRGENIRF